jgi:TM2 domain-containing membrane protein YozV
MKSKGVAYVLWLVALFGVLGFHRFYLGKIGTGLIWMFTGGVFGVGALIDLFTLGGQVEQHNTNLELKSIRASALVAQR